jgi:hypothetical protein
MSLAGAVHQHSGISGYLKSENSLSAGALALVSKEICLDKAQIEI